MPIESLHARKKLSVVTTGYQDLCACANGGLEDGEGTSGQLMLFNLSDLIFPICMILEDCAAIEVFRGYVRQLGPRFGEKLSVCCQCLHFKA